MTQILIGADQTASSTDVTTNENWAFFWQPFIASVSGTLTELGVDVPSGYTEACVLAIYDNSSAPNGVLLAKTAQFNLTGASITQPLLSSIPITAGTTYNIAGFMDEAYPFVNADASTTHIVYKQSGLTFPTLPTPLATNDSSSAAPLLALWGSGTTGASSQKGGMFFADNFRPKIPVVAAAMFMPLSWSINRRNKRAAERRAVLDTLKRGR